MKFCHGKVNRVFLFIILTSYNSFFALQILGFCCTHNCFTPFPRRGTPNLNRPSDCFNREPRRSGSGWFPRPNPQKKHSLYLILHPRPSPTSLFPSRPFPFFQIPMSVLAVVDHKTDLPPTKSGKLPTEVAVPECGTIKTSYMSSRAALQIPFYMGNILWPEQLTSPSSFYKAYT